MRRSNGTALPDNNLVVSYKNKPITTKKKKPQQLYSWAFIEEKSLIQKLVNVHNSFIGNSSKSETTEMSVHG